MCVHLKYPRVVWPGDLKKINPMQTTITPFASYSDFDLNAIKQNLINNLSIIDGTYKSTNPKFKHKPFSHMKDAWTKSLELIETELKSRSK